MRHEFNFKTPLPGPLRQYVFAWDDETGELDGDGADDIRYWAELAVEAGVISCPELNGDIPATDPLRIKAEFCALIGLDRLPAGLKSFYPTRDYPGFVGFDQVDNVSVITPDINVIF